VVVDGAAAAELHIAGDFLVVAAAAAGAKIDKDHPAAVEQHAIVPVVAVAVADLLDSSLVVELLVVLVVVLSVVESCYYQHPTATAAAAVGKTAAAVVLVHYQL
jgi:hypothetical protein